MPADAQLPKPEKTSWRRFMLAPMVALAVLVAVVLLAPRWLPVFPTPPKNVVLHQSGEGWQRLPALPGYPGRLQVSRGGAVWVQTWGDAGLNRLEGSAWRSYTGADFGTQKGYVSGGFVLDGEEVWAATSDGVVHWDGQRWRCFPEAVASRQAHSITAGGGQVWVIDRGGNLSHFEAGRWTIHRIELEGEKWGDEPETRPPALARTSDGGLWLVRSGVWRFAGTKWAAVTPGGRKLKEAMLIGQTTDRIWLWDGEGLRSISMDGGSEAAYTLGQIGLSGHEWILDAVSAGGRTWFATSDGILEFDGVAWRHLAPFRGGIKAVMSIGLGPDGALWAIGVPPPDTSVRRGWWMFMALPLALLIGFAGVGLWLFKRLNRRKLEEHQRLRQAVEHATGEVPRELERAEQRLARDSSWWGGLVFVGEILAALIGYGILRALWQGAPAWTFVAIALGLHLAVTFVRSLTKRKPKPWDPIGPGGPPRYDWGITRKAVAGVVVVFLLLNPQWLPWFVEHPLMWLFAALATMLSYTFLRSFFLMRALRRGDYDRALKVIRVFHFYHPEGAGALRTRGAVLLLAGRYREAEDTLRRAIARLRTGIEQALALDDLGDALVEQGRYDEAMRSYEAALHAAPGFRLPYLRMAELLLRQGKNPERALEYAERANDRAGVSLRDRRFSRLTQHVYSGVKAWALARLGRSAEVAPAIENALKATNQKSPLDLAGTHYRAGKAMQALGQEAAAKEHFQRALECDPEGRRGTLAKAELGRRSVWGSVKA